MNGSPGILMSGRRKADEFGALVEDRVKVVLVLKVSVQTNAFGLQKWKGRADFEFPRLFKVLKVYAWFWFYEKQFPICAISSRIDMFAHKFPVGLDG